MTDGRRNQRTVKATKVPGIPKPPTDVPASLQRYLSNLGEALEIRLGRKGDVRDRAITLRELIDSGMAVDLINNPYDPSNPGGDFSNPPDDSGGDVQLPTAPTGFSVTVGFSNVGLFWDYPETQYRGHSYTEIFRNTTNNQATALLVGVSPGSAYTDFHGTVTSTTTFYYWVRHVNVNDERGPFNANSGEPATLSPNTDFILDLLDDSIEASHLVQSLRDPINNLPANTNATFLAVETDVTDLEAQYTVKIQQNFNGGSYISGYGLASEVVNGTPVSSFVVSADRFAIINPTTYNVGQTSSDPSTNYRPFQVQTTSQNITLPSGEVVNIQPGVYIRDVFVSKARILDLIAGSVTADFVLSSTFVRAPNIHGGTFNIGTFSQNGSSDPSNWTVSGGNRVSNFSVDSGGIMHCEAAQLKGVTVLADDNTVLMDAGGMHSSSGNNLAFNGNFARKETGNEPYGWVTEQGSVTYGANFVRVYSNGARVRQTTNRFPVVNGETLYVYCQTNVYQGTEIGVSFYSTESGTTGFVQSEFVDHTSGTLKLQVVTGGNGDNRGFGVAAITVPTSTSIKFGELRFASNNSTGVYYYNVGVSRTPPVIDPSYVQTYIRDLSVDSFQIKGEAVTQPVGDVDGNYDGPVANGGWTDYTVAGPVTWTDSRDKPSKICVIATANVLATGNSSTYRSVHMRVLRANNAGFSNAVQVSQVGASKQANHSNTLALTAEVDTTNIGSGQYFKLQVWSDYDGGSGTYKKVRNNGLTVFGLRK